ncbi:MAG: TAT-variant-translocated molybdopterin oxidoreductase [Chloroflexota bacterium]|nr:TAT-variant-translocated molybdopterin oxidoreductase [Chloroflexota bacterium]
MSDTQKQALDIEAIRIRLAEQRGKTFWRSLEELAETPEFQEFLYREFPRQASEWVDGMSRRNFLKLMGASLALAGLTACGQPTQDRERIVPYVQQPEELLPGEPRFFATAATMGGYASGILVESHIGRPTKIEGNPNHPASLGATTAQTQASILTLYDPDRSQVVTNVDRIATWERFLEEIGPVVERLQATGGGGLRILTETVTSPTLIAQMADLLDLYPEARWHRYEPVNHDNVLNGARLAFGEPVEPIYQFDEASVVLSLDSNFLFDDPVTVRYAYDFIRRRAVRAELEGMNRLYVVESSSTITGAKADHRMPLRASQIEDFARVLASVLGVEAVDTTAAEASLARLPEGVERWIRAIADDLLENRGQSIVIAGDYQPPVVHALAHAMNDALDNIGNTLYYIEPVEAVPVDQSESLAELVAAMAAGEVDVLFILGANPVYYAPADLDFAGALENVDLRVHLGLYRDETAFLSHWHLPQSHFLEIWSDARAYDGTATILQPLIEPLYRTRSIHEVLGILMGERDLDAYELVRSFWQGQVDVGEDEFERFWETVLFTGIVPETASPPMSVQLALDELQAREDVGEEIEGLELIFRPDPSIWDGRFANNAWLQELPKHLTKLTWDNAALISPLTAQAHDVTNEDVVELRFRGGVVEAPVFLLPGHPENTVTVYLGYGRLRGGRVAGEQGFNAYQLRTTETPWFGSGLQIEKTGEEYPLATTQHHWSMEGRDHVRRGTFAEYLEEPHFVEEEEHPDISLYPEWEYDSYAWGMAIDITACIGCNACVVACQSENNIPVVGKEEVLNHREMHWLRVDRYYTGELGNPETYFQPMLCMHCEKAPCEVVCPVAATTHSSEGLNQMTYNRCVGTRYCSNNCPYKVRRFNFLSYTDYEDTPVLKLLQNPDVTVRSRGVMEKCSYCVQRINAAWAQARVEDRPIRDGEVVTACQAACPTRAIIFGDIADPDTLVAQLKASPLNYTLLGELNTQPRTTYLAALRNPNPTLIEEESV